MQALFDYIISTENRYNNVVDVDNKKLVVNTEITESCLLYTSPSPRDKRQSRMPSSA